MANNELERRFMNIRRNYRIQATIGNDRVGIEAEGDKEFVREVFKGLNRKNMEALSKNLQTPSATANRDSEVEEEEELGEELMLTLSDWITFLSGEKNSNLTNIVAVGAVALAAIGIVGTDTLGGWWRVTALLSIWVIVNVLLRLFETRFNKASRLLKKIMRGELKNVTQINNEWNR
jgi:hypothetical protein